MEIKSIIERYNEFYFTNKRNIMIKTQFPLRAELKNLTYTTYNLNTWEGLKNYYDVAIENNIKIAESHIDIEDDFIPELFSHLGTGAGGAIFDNALVTFTDVSSWVHQSVFSYDELSRLTDIKETVWAKNFLDITSYLMDKCSKDLCVTPLMHYTPLDAANSLRGSDVFYDMYEFPDELKKLLEYCKNVIISLHSKLMNISGNVFGGQAMWNIWLPGKDAIGFMEDTSNLCSSKNYCDFGRDYTEAIVKYFKAAFIHNHMLGIHQFENISSIKNLTVLNVANDPKCKTVIESINEIKPILKTPIYFELSYDELKKNIDKLQDIKSIVWVHCKNEEEAKQAVALTR